MNFYRPLFLACLFALGVAAPVRSQPSEPPSRPNIILILADDIGYGELGCYGEERYATPHIDAVAREGLRFLDFYGAPECSPSRGSLMTGKHSGHETVRANFSYDSAGKARRVGLGPADRTVAAVLRDSGYATACIGKWGLGADGSAGIPNRQGFDFFYGFLDDAHAHNYYPEFIYKNADKVALPGNYGFAEKTYIDDQFMKEVHTFLNDHRKGPFFLYLALTLPHGKLTPPPGANLDRALNRSDERTPSKVDPTSPVFAAMVQRVDDDVGSVMAQLKELGIDQSTLVFVASDNGPAHVGPTADDTVDVAYFQGSGALRGEKSDVYEGGIRVPFIARWPGKIAPGKVTTVPLAMSDFLPTVAEAAGAQIPAGLDGISFLPSLLGQPQARHPYLYWEFVSKGQVRIAVREEKWKLDQYGLGKPVELYDLAADPGETRNVVSERPEIRDRLVAIAKEAHTDSSDYPLRENPRLRSSAPNPLPP